MFKERSGYLFLYGEILTCFDTLLNEFSNIDKIYYNIIECGYGKSQEQKLNRFLKRKNVEVFSFYDHHLHSANKVLKEDNSHYKVFTHYYNKWMCSKNLKNRILIMLNYLRLY